MEYYVYIMASHSKVLYVGVTNDLRRRVYQHRNATRGFVAQFNVRQLVYFEDTGNISAAIAREKQLKRLPRRRKLRLIEAFNPFWNDLSAGWAEAAQSSQ